jgi:hypothetical protein
LELLRAKGEVTQEEYESLLAEYATLQSESEANVEEIRGHLHEKEQGLRDGRRQLQEEVRQLDLRQKVGELNAQQADRARRRLQSQLEAMDRKLLRLEAALNARTSADVGGYMDVDVRARVEPGAGVLGDELDAPELVGAAQESLKEWQGRAQELYSTARDRGKEWVERKEVASATDTVRDLGGRAKARLDEAAARGTEAINRQLEKRGRSGISPSALKVAVAILLLILFLFFLVGDSYPETPTRVLEAAWAAANTGQGEDVEPYLSVLTMDWMREALEMMPGKTVATLLREKWAARTHQETVDHLEIIQENVKESRATVQYRVHYEDGKASPPRTQQFVLEGGRWKLESRLVETF